ncbi:MAG: Ig-like domain-containing protein, partial [Cyanobacteria bacterium]|nr:Ig-like domain-containing protein [Cyanobacteriota bacterium]MDW8202036.1 Ig-like domain-containing protein [Cyanobacteriota bacterium SKYGB_h_bin112]
MRNLQRLAQAGLWFLLALGIVVGLANWASLTQRQPQLTAAVFQTPQFVAAVADPKLPDWIQQISPTGEADSLAQIRVRFQEPLIPIEQIDTPNQKAILSKFQLTPPLAGEFRFLTPRMVGFQAAQALPAASRIQVTLKAGLADLKNHQLSQDLVWTFTTPAIVLSNFPGKPISGFPEDAYYDDQPVELQPSFRITANVELDLGDLRKRLQLLTTDGNKTIPLNIVPYTEDSNTPRTEF